MGLTADIKALLISAGVDTTNNIFRNDIPDTPDSIIAIFDSGGYSSQFSLGGSTPDYEQPTFQIRVRSPSYDTAITKLEAIKTALDGITNRVIGARTYISIFLQSDILPLGRDDKKRCDFSINFVCKIKR